MSTKGVFTISEVSGKILDNAWITCVDPFESYCTMTWGGNLYGAQGLNTCSSFPGTGRVDVSSPVQLPGSWCYAANGFQSTEAGVKGDGSAYLWGWTGDIRRNLPACAGIFDGLLTALSYSSPVQIPGSWKQVWAASTTDGNGCPNISNIGYLIGINNSCEVYYAGCNSYGVFGLNSTGEFYCSWVRLPGNWCVVRSQGGRSVGIKTDGTLWAWGFQTALVDSESSLGINPSGCCEPVSSPIQIPGNWCSIDLSVNSIDVNFIGVKTDGTLWTWGCHKEGLLGNNQAAVPTSSPVQVPGTWVSADLGYRSASARKSDGSVFVWGDNAFGHLGVNSTLLANYSSPVQVPGTWIDVQIGTNHSAGIKTDNTLFTWGRNVAGEIGNNNIASNVNNGCSSPVQIPGTNWRLLDSCFGMRCVSRAIKY